MQYRFIFNFARALSAMINFQTAAYVIFLCSGGTGFRDAWGKLYVATPFPDTTCVATIALVFIFRNPNDYTRKSQVTENLKKYYDTYLSCIFTII